MVQGLELLTERFDLLLEGEILVQLAVPPIDGLISKAMELVKILSPLGDRLDRLESE